MTWQHPGGSFCSMDICFRPRHPSFPGTGLWPAARSLSQICRKYRPLRRLWRLCRLVSAMPSIICALDYSMAWRSRRTPHERQVLGLPNGNSVAHNARTAGVSQRNFPSFQNARSATRRFLRCSASTVQPSAISFGAGSTRDSRFAAPRSSTPNEPQIPLLEKSLRLFSAL
jgi:hypothetical protein